MSGQAPTADTDTTAAPSTTLAAQAPLADLDDLDGVLAPGTYVVTRVEPFEIMITVPEGWVRETTPSMVWSDAGSAAYVEFVAVDNVYADPFACDPVGLDPPVGPTVDDLVAALAALPGNRNDRTPGRDGRRVRRPVHRTAGETRSRRRPMRARHVDHAIRRSGCSTRRSDARPLRPWAPAQGVDRRRRRSTASDQLSRPGGNHPPAVRRTATRSSSRSRSTCRDGKPRVGERKEPVMRSRLAGLAAVLLMTLTSLPALAEAVPEGGPTRRNQ